MQVIDWEDWSPKWIVLIGTLIPAHSFLSTSAWDIAYYTPPMGIIKSCVSNVSSVAFIMNIHGAHSYWKALWALQV